MNLVIDMGNTLTKVALFERGNLLDVHRYDDFSEEDIPYYFRKHPIKMAIISSVGSSPESLLQYISGSQNCPAIILDHHLPLPFQILYETPETLGKDRVAGVAGAFYEFPEENILLIDAGTCITYDLLTADGIYHGGAISPGLRMRYRAMNTFTKNLPLPEQQSETPLTGKNTNGSLHSGVLHGTVNEVDGMIDEYRNEYGSLKVVFTGGDLNYFDKKLKNNIFARPNIVITGLNKILEHYFEKKSST